jgi:hypothetical protein
MATGDGALLAGRYRIVRRLGSGGMASVYEADDERLGRSVAVKRLHAESADEVARRFQREARVGASLNHPNLVAVYDAVSDEEGVLIVMEYVDGPTLAQRLRKGPLDRDEAVGMLDGVAAALDHAHAAGVVHRDVKPANVLLGAGGLVKLADLGIAGAMEGTRITRSGAVLGTPAYMAPEQIMGARTGPATDVYALAAVAYEALSGQRARPGRTPMEIAHRAATEPAPDLRSAWPDAPPAAAEALLRGMAREPADRPGSAGALVAELARALEPAGPAAKVAPAARGPAPTAPLGPEGLAPKTPLAQGRPAAKAAPAGAGAGPVPNARPVGTAGPAPASRPRRPAPAAPRRAGPWALAAALAAIVLAGTLALWLAQDGEDRATPGGQPTAPSPGRSAPPPPSPADTVQAFYELAAADRFEEAWALAGEGWREQLGGYRSFRSGDLSQLESISFSSLEPTSVTGDSARVSARTVARLASRTDACRSTYELRRTGGRWRIEDGSVQCRPAGAG